MASVHLLTSSSVGWHMQLGYAHEGDAAPTELGFDFEGCADYKHGAPNGALLGFK